MISPKFKKLVTVLAVILLAIGTFLIVNFYRVKGNHVSKTLKTIRQKSTTTINLINKEFQNIENMAAELENYVLSSPKTADLEKRLEEVVKKNDHISGCGLAFQPYKYQKDQEMYAPYYVGNEKKNKMLYLNKGKDGYNYLKKGPYSNWYHKALKRDTYWQDPYFGKAYGGYLVEFTKTIKKDNEVIGIVYLNYPFSRINALINKLMFGLKVFGYGCMFSTDGTVIYHPSAELVLSRKNIFDVARENSSEVLENSCRLALQGKEDVVRYKSPVSDIDGWLAFEPIKSSGWGFLIIMEKNSTEMNSSWSRRRLMEISFTLIAAITILLFVFLKNSWIASIISSAAAITGVIVIWSMVVNFEHIDKDTLKSRSEIDKHIKYYTTSFQNNYQIEPTFIPTGIFLQSIEYENANNIRVTGYVWQKYDLKKHADLQRGLIFPEALSVSFDEAYRKKNGNEELIGWYFDGVIRESFDYRKYPFDSDDFWIRMWHKDFTKNIILVPDYESYGCHLAPHSLPGIEKDFVIGEWNLDSSYFSMRNNSYNSSFGFHPESFIRKDKFPELYFNVKLSRKFIDAFISHLIPLVIVTALLFLILVIDTKEKPFALTASGLFFVLIFDHIGLRNSLSVNGIVYLEYFYFILYFGILFTSVVTFLYATDSKLKMITHGDKKIPKLIYFPMINAILYLVTICVYY